MVEFYEESRQEGDLEQDGTYSSYGKCVAYLGSLLYFRDMGKKEERQEHTVKESPPRWMGV